MSSGRVYAVLGTAVVVASVLSVASVGAISAMGITDSGNLQTSNNNGGDGQMISHVVFCTPENPDDVTFSVTDRNEDGEPTEIEWSSASTLDEVVLKYSTTYESFPGGTSGTATVGDGTVVTDRSERFPCDDGTSGVKYEYDEENDEFVLEDE